MSARDRFLAFDKASVRRYDQDGRLHVRLTPISKANVCPYLGEEIPDDEKLGLETGRIYMLLRDPKELEKSVPTWNGIPLLIKHKPVTASDPKKDLVVGSTGTDAMFDGVYLCNSLTVWDDEAIDGIESEEQKELSCGYRYEADMTPGTFEGVHYDGVMRKIRGNHVALVVEGRAGSDIVVGDSKLNEGDTAMSEKQYLSRKAAFAMGALAVYLQPKLAQDAKVDIAPALIGITSSNWKQRKAGLAAAVTKLVKGKLAQDADVGDIGEMLNNIDKSGGQQENDMQAKPAVAAGAQSQSLGVDDPDADLDGVTDDDPSDAIMQLLQGCNCPPEVMQKIMAMLAPKKPATTAVTAPGAVPGVDSPVDQAGASGAPAKVPATAGDPTMRGAEALPDKAGMDAAIKSACEATEKRTIQRMRDIAQAEADVLDFIGKVPAMDSADAVYKLCLESEGVSLKGVPPAAYRAMVGMLQKRGADAPPREKLGEDGKQKDNVVSFNERYPEAGRIRNRG